MTDSAKQTPPCVNELLCFVQNKLDTIPFDTLVRVCSEFYSYDVIYKSKQLLYTAFDVETRMRKHIGEEKSMMEMKDILQVLLEAPMPYKHVFLARDLANLPALSHLNSDTGKILKEIEILRTEMKSVVINQKGMAEELANVRKTLHKPNTPASQILTKSKDEPKVAVTFQAVNAHKTVCTSNATDVPKPAQASKTADVSKPAQGSKAADAPETEDVDIQPVTITSDEKSDPDDENQESDAESDCHSPLLYSTAVTRNRFQVLSGRPRAPPSKQWSRT
jgi:hypothetical protein